MDDVGYEEVLCAEVPDEGTSKELSLDLCYHLSNKECK